MYEYDSIYPNTQSDLRDTVCEYYSRSVPAVANTNTTVRLADDGYSVVRSLNDHSVSFKGL